jgi:hypothetical protein
MEIAEMRGVLLIEVSANMGSTVTIGQWVA